MSGAATATAPSTTSRPKNHKDRRDRNMTTTTEKVGESLRDSRRRASHGVTPLRLPCGAVERLALGDDDDALLGDLEAALAIVIRMDADGRVRRDLDVLVDDGLLDAAVAADVDALEQDRVLYNGEAVDADARGQNAVADMAARDDAALA